MLERDEGGTLSDLHTGHPTPAGLQRFLRGEAARTEARAVVRHLLAGCLKCVAVTRPAWGLRGGTNGGHDVIEGARQELRAAARDLKSIRYRMLGVHASIPPASQETSKGDLAGEMDVETEIRNVIACGIQDSLDPLIDDWLNAASYQPERREAAGNAGADSLSIAHLDLSVFSEETRQALYEVVAAENFGSTALEPPCEGSVLPYTAEQAGLEVTWAWGRWFATWWKLELQDTLPEAQRRETLLLEENRARPGTLAYREV